MTLEDINSAWIEDRRIQSIDNIGSIPKGIVFKPVGTSGYDFITIKTIDGIKYRLNHEFMAEYSECFTIVKEYVDVEKNEATNMRDDEREKETGGITDEEIVEALMGRGVIKLIQDLNKIYTKGMVFKSDFPKTKDNGFKIGASIISVRTVMENREKFVYIGGVTFNRDDKEDGITHEEIRKALDGYGYIKLTEDLSKKYIKDSIFKSTLNKDGDYRFIRVDGDAGSICVNTVIQNSDKFKYYKNEFIIDNSDDKGVKERVCIGTMSFEGDELDHNIGSYKDIDDTSLRLECFKIAFKLNGMNEPMGIKTHQCQNIYDFVIENGKSNIRDIAIRLECLELAIQSCDDLRKIVIKAGRIYDWVTSCDDNVEIKDK